MTSHDHGKLRESPSQTAGPYVHIGCMPNFAGIDGVFPRDLGATMVNSKTGGESIVVTGRVLDGSGAALKDAMVEIWQADSAGLYKSPNEKRGAADPHFSGWGRQPTNLEDGVFRFETIKPGAVPYSPDRFQAPHINFWIVARGINLGLNTRMYFEDETDANAADPLLGQIGKEGRVQTLISTRERNVHTFDIHIQGDRETVFFAI